MSTAGTSATLPNAAHPQARNGSAAASQDDGGQRQAAWQREMERAQIATWFKPPVATRPDASAAMPPTAPVASPRAGVHTERAGIAVIAGVHLPAMTVLPGASLAAALPMGESSVEPVWGNAPLAPMNAAAGLRSTAPPVDATHATQMPESDAIRRTGGPMQAPGSGPPEGAAEAAAPEAAEQPRAQSPAPDEAPAPLRLHEEATPYGQAVWIAMRADDEALAAMLPRIVSDLQRDMQQVRGQRLHQVVCNGRLVWRDGTLSIPDGERRPFNVFDSFQTKGA
jgi:hypothetical protein